VENLPPRSPDPRAGESVRHFSDSGGRDSGAVPYEPAEELHEIGVGLHEVTDALERNTEQIAGLRAEVRQLGSIDGPISELSSVVNTCLVGLADAVSETTVPYSVVEDIHRIADALGAFEAQQERREQERIAAGGRAPARRKVRQPPTPTPQPAPPTPEEAARAFRG
jgi:hypothetical protein